MCPYGYGDSDCSSNQPPKSLLLNLFHGSYTDADCGGKLKAAEEWAYIESPGYADEGYAEDQTCNWVIASPLGTRVELEFVDEFSFLCSNICLDYVEVKLTKDQRNTGPRRRLILHKFTRFLGFAVLTSPKKV